MGPATGDDDAPGQSVAAKGADSVANSPSEGSGGHPAPPPHAFGVLAHAAEALGPAGAFTRASVPADTEGASVPQAPEGFVAGFRILAEDVAFDLRANAALGLLLLWVSLRRLDRFLPRRARR